MNSKGVATTLNPNRICTFCKKGKIIASKKSILPMNAHLDMNNKRTKHTVHIRSVNAHI